MVFLGFSSGLPLALTSSTLQAWLTVAELDIRTIGIFALVGLPYTLKFCWAPLVDWWTPPFLGRRRGWMVITQVALIAGIAAMAGLPPGESIWLLGLLALGVAFFSASQDIAFDAYRADTLRPAERGLGAAVSVTGYRLAMLVSGGLALILSDQIGFPNTYLIMAALLSLGVMATLWGPEPEWGLEAPRSLRSAVVDPLKEFLARPEAAGFLLLIVLYKLGDALAGTLTSAFLIRGLGFSATEVGVINKGLGLASLLFGTLVGGILLVRLGLLRALLIFGVLQALSNLGFLILAAVGKHYTGMAIVVALENGAGGMGTAALVALLMALCNHRYTATQYALLSSFASLGRVLVGPAAGYGVEALGWQGFFFVTCLAALPGIWWLWLLRRPVRALEGV
jgi:PAT family beta-lactamase induction signal transducer AmpG